jgi:hypothetical protein
LLAVVGIWTALAAAIVVFGAALWLMALLAFGTLPALWDLWRNPMAGLTLDDAVLRWFSGKRHAEVAFPEIDLVRFDTRLDFSVRATVILRTGRKLRLPFEATPPHLDFEAALVARGLKTERHHFSPFN